mgnify:CR=1 FL=1
MLTLLEECRDGNAAAIAQLLDGGADVEAVGGRSKTPLCSAAAGGHTFGPAGQPRRQAQPRRHPAARYELTYEDIATGRQRADGVAKAAWPMEDHTIPGRPIYTPVGGEGWASIPLDALRAKDIDNLYFAGRTIGADPRAYASIRVMGTAFATGDAAGRAAAQKQ